MSTYVLPDGKKIKIPTDPTERLQLVTAVKNRYGIDLDDTNVLTQAFEAVKAIPRGAANLALSAPTGLAALVDIGDDGSVLKKLRETKRYLDEDSILAGDPLYADMFSTKLGEGVGSFVPFLGAARVGQILAKGSKAIPKPFLGMDLASRSFQVPAALSVPVGMSEQADRIEMSRQLGEDVGGVAETLATLTGGVIGISELLPITSFLKKVPKAASRNPEIKEKIIQAIKYFGKGGLQEGTQEVLASLAQDVTAAGFYSDELPIGESMFDEFAIGGIIGGTANVVLKSMIGKKRSVTDSYLKDSEEKFRNLSDKDIEIRKKRYSDAQTQGTLDVVQEQLNTVTPDVPLPIDIGLSPNIEISQDADGKFSLIDMQENKKINTFENETQAIVAKDKIVNEYNNNLENNKIDNDLYNLGLINSSTGRVIGKTVQNKNVTEVPLQVLMNYEKSISTARQKQADEQTKIEEKLANNNEEQSKIEKQIADNNKEIQIINAEGQGFTMQSSTAQSTAVVPFRKRKQNGKFRTIPEIQKENQRLIKKINKLDPLISKRANLDKAESVLKKKGLPLKETYTLEEAKQALSPQDFNQLLTERADVVFRASDKKGEPSITAGKSKPNTSNQYIKEVAATKNIELNFNDPAVKYAAKQWTGIENIANTKVEGARRLFLARLHALPTFSKALPFPDFRTRTHTAEETAEFIAKARDQLSTFDLKSLQAMNKDQQFLDDLVYSGRAERVEGTKNYRLVNNADFEIARRSEGFNETPTEYRTRLEAEAKLDPKVIDEMVQEEEVKQAKFLPPKEIEQQQINYAEAIEEGKTNKFAKEARKILNKTGLKETGIVISNDILSPTGLVEVDGKFAFNPEITRQYNVEGEYDRNNDVIFLSLNAVNPDGNASDQEIQNALNKIIDHEMIHALRAKDVITEKEYKYLRTEVKRRKVPVSFDSTSKGETFYERSKRINTQFEQAKYNVNEFKKEELYVEEAIAELYRARNIKPDVPPKAETIFQKVIQFFKSMGQAFRNSGYQKASDVFADIESGKVGSRTRGQVRTLRDIDQTLSGLGGYNPYQTAPAFSRTRTPTQSAADQYNITKLEENALYTGKPLDVSATKDRLNKYTDEQLFEIGADAQRGSIEGMFSNYDKAVGYLSTSMSIGDLYGASMGFGTNGNIMAIKPIARLAEKLRKPSVTDTYNHPPDIEIYKRKFSEMTAEQKAVASRYAEASKKLPTFNEVQWMARQFNIALGELNLPLLTRVSDYFQDASLPNNIKNVIDKSTKIDPYYIEIPDIEYFDNIVKKLYKNSASGNFLPDKNVPLFSVKNTAKRFDTGENDRFGNPMFSYEYRGYQIQKVEIEQNNYPKPNTYYEAWNVTDSEGYTTDTENTLKEAKRRVNQYSDGYESIDDVPLFSRSRNPNQERIDSLNQVLAGIQGQLRESTSPKTVTRLRARERKLKDEIEMLEGLPDDDAPLFSRTGRKHGVDRAYTIESEGEITGKPSVVKVMTDNNADEVIENLQGLLDRHPSALDSEEAWLAFERDLVGDNETFIPPSNLIALVNNLDSWKNLHTNKLNKKQLQNVDLGFRAVEEMRKIYADGTATPETTAKLMAWGMLSRKATASNQESAFIDAANDPKLNEFIARALEKEFTDVDVKEYLEWSGSVMPEGSFGKSVTNNLHDFGKLFLKKTSKKQANGISKLEAIHNLFANQDLSSVEIRREYYKIVQNSGINNKVLSFNLLMSGRNDVVVLDRIQINNMWDAKNKYQKNIYGDVNNQLNNIHGLARYEIMEKALLNKIDSLYEAIGRPQDSSVGRYHWESWVRSSNQEVEHPSVQGIYKEALEGMDSKPYADLGVPEGRYNFYNYGATYVRGADGNAYVNYPKSNGDMAKFSLEQYNEFINLVKKPSTGVVPKGFLVSKIKEGFPWYEIEGVNREKLDQIIESYAKRTTSTRKVLQDNGENIQSDVTRRRESPETRRRREQLKEITDEVAPQPTELDVPLFSRKNRDSSQGNTSEAIARRRAVESVVETVKRTPKGNIPHYNANASDVALEAAYNFNNDPTAPTPEIPKFSINTAVPDYLEKDMDRVGRSTTKKTQFESIMDVIQNPVESIRYMFKEFRTNFIDKLSAVDKKLLEAQEPEWYLQQGRINPKTKKAWTEQEAEEQSRAFRLLDNNILTRSMAFLRLADRSRGVFQGMLTMGFVTDRVVDKNAEDGTSESIAVIEGLRLVDENNKETGQVGGFIQFMSSLYQRTDFDMVSIFGYYGKIKRPEMIDVKTGQAKASPITDADRANAARIEKDFPEVVAAYNNYQNWNNKLIEFAKRKGILTEEQAAEWIANSHYYPYYRDMAMSEEELESAGIVAPTISGGALPQNPLDIELKGSETPITVDPIEAISRNSLSILTAALKNDGTVKLLKDLETMGLADNMGTTRNRKFDNDGNLINDALYVHAYENGEKYFYIVKDIEIFEALSSVGGSSTSTLTKWVGMPATLLRDTVTRDPGFIVVNILRDTLSAAVTSGAMYGKAMGGIDEGYLPVIDSFKNMFGDISDLEKFGIVGGYDFSNDEGSVKQFVERTMRRQGLTKKGAMKPQDAFFKLWDGLGELTTKSDGATRKAVYDSVYKHMIKKGATEGQAQSEAAYQALEVINFGRRGLSPIFKTITAGIPFLNARIQGLDVLYRSFVGGQYSAIDKIEGDETRADLKGRIIRGAILRGMTLALITGLYYMMVSDTDEYKGARREVRDDYWIIPTGTDFPIRIPIPFEVGAIFKVLPERLIDMAMGDDAFTKKAVGEAKTSLGRQLETSLNLPFTQPAFGFQILKPFMEVLFNRNSFTDSEIIPYYQQKLDPRAQSTARTNELARLVGETFNISPMKIDYVMRGYAGTLGGYLLSMADTGTRMITGTPILPNNVELSRLPLMRRLTFDSKKAGGLQQQFYELRGEVDSVVQTINKLNTDGRADEAVAYRSNMQGVLNVKGQIRSMERYLSAWRTRRNKLLQRDDISITVRSDMLRDMEIERDRRLAMIPELRKQANIPITSFGL